MFIKGSHRECSSKGDTGKVHQTVIQGMFISSCERDAMAALATLVALRQDDRQFAVAKLGMSVRNVKGTFKPDCAGKPPELPLHKMKSLIRSGPGRGLFARDEQNARAVEHANGGRGHP